MDKNIPFPQADDFNKVITLLNIDSENNLKNKSKVSILFDGIADRQVQYYLSACMYLGFIDEKKEFTPLGKKLRSLSRTEQEIELAQMIVSHDIFGHVYFLEKRLETKLDRNYVIELLKTYVKFESEEMYKRRSQTIIKWIEWINDKFNDEF
ncbi:MAG: hypothetical protein SPJ52_04340 [Candidatus Enterosoma sp.]|nr:hypothetical protein [bacterium]MDY5866351.1 hypothetical protein [Candidatus Enterosoma sp.]